MSDETMSDETITDTVELLRLAAMGHREAISQNAEGCTDIPCPAAMLEAAADEITGLRRRLEFIELLCDGGQILVNGVPWREMFERFNAIVSDPVPVESAPAT